MSRRALWYVLAFVVLLLHAYRIPHLFVALPVPVSVSISGPSQEEMRTIRVVRVGATGQETVLQWAEGGSEWPFQGGWYKDLRIWAPDAVVSGITRLTVTVGDQSFGFSSGNLRAYWHVSGDSGAVQLLVAPKQIRAAETSLPLVSSVMNWPGMGRALGVVFGYPPAVTVMALFAMLLLVALLMRISRVENVFRIALEGGSGAVESSRKAHLIWFAGGAAVLVAGLTIVEVLQPYYFVQDDNYGQFLPVIVEGCRSLFAGLAPEWNPYQFLGCPTASQGVYGLTYPATWVAYAIARFILGNDLLTLDVYAIGHLLAGYAVTYHLARRVGVRPCISAAAAVSFALSGYFLIAGRSWIFMVPVAVWLPALLLCAERLRGHRATWGWVLATGACIGLYFHAGNAQMWFYSLMFVFLAVLTYVLTRRMTLARAAGLVPALVLGAAIAAPLLIPQLLETADVARVRRFGGGIGYDGLAAMFLPWPLVQAGHPNNWGNLFSTHMTHFYYAGTLFAAVAVPGALAMTVRRWSGYLVAKNVWLLLGGLALLFSLGRAGLIWDLSLYMPVFGKFKHAFKFLPFAVLFFGLGGGLMLDRLLRGDPTRKRWEPIIAAVVGMLMLYHAWMAKPSFYSYTDVPYRGVPGAVSDLVADENGEVAGRLRALAPTRSTDPAYSRSLHLNLATYHRVPALGGFDPLIADGPLNVSATVRLEEEPLPTMEAYGVDRVIALIRPEGLAYTTAPEVHYLEDMRVSDVVALDAVISAVGAADSVEGVAVWRLTNSRPMAFPVSDSSRALPGGRQLGGVCVSGSAEWPQANGSSSISCAGRS